MEKLIKYIQKELNFAKYHELTQEKQSAYNRATGALLLYIELYPETYDTVALVWMTEYKPAFERILYEE